MVQEATAPRVEAEREPIVRRTRLGFLLSDVTRLLIAADIAALFVLVVAALMPSRLGATDIVGYPIFYDYDINWIDKLYLVAFILAPAIAVALYVALTNIARRLGVPIPARAAGADALEMQAPSRPAVSPWVPAISRVVLAGALVAAEVAVFFSISGTRFWLLATAVVAAYALLALAGSWLLSRTISVAGLARANTLLTPVAILGLAGVAAATTVYVQASNTVHHYPWLPAWIGVLGFAIGVAVLWTVLNRAKTAAAVLAVERWALLVITAPVAIFFLLARLPAELYILDAYHEGEHLAASHLTLGGYFPWRDLFSTHGLLEDSVLPLLGMLIQDSRWGFDAGSTIFLTPLTFVTLYALLAWLFWRDWAFLAALIVLMPDERLVPFADGRFLFWPLLLVVLGLALTRGRWWITAALGVALVVQAIVVPEAAYCIPACGLVLVLYEWVHRRPGVAFLRQFPLTLGCLAGGVASTLVFAVWLLTQHALTDWVFYYVIFAPGHALTGGLPVRLHRSDSLEFVFLAGAPAVALFAGMAYFAIRVIRGRVLSAAEWVVGASGLFALLYYPKLLDRFDFGHALQVYVATIPLLAFLAFKACEAGNSWVRRQGWGRGVWRWTTRPVTLVALALALVTTTTPLPSRLDSAAGHYQMTAQSEPALQKLGYAKPDARPDQFTDVQAVLDAYLKPGDWVFDFTNAPAVYYYLLGLKPETRYFNVSMALPESSQKDLISQLERDRPKIVVFDSDRWGQPGWDGIPNEVRHYDVSQYILDNYRPLLMVDGQILYADSRAGLSADPVRGLALSSGIETEGLPFAGQPCNWGFAPNFLAISPPTPASAAAPVTLQPTAGALADTVIAGWAGDPSSGEAASKIVVTAGGKVVAAAVPDGQRPDVAALYGQGLASSGFAVSIPTRLLQGANGLLPVQVYGVSPRGMAAQLPYLNPAFDLAHGAAPAAQLQLADGTRVDVRADALTGSVDSAVVGQQQWVITLPPGAAWTDYRWLQVSTAGPLQREQWTISDSEAFAGHEILFNALPAANGMMRVHVGSCSQWHGYQGAIYLTHTGSESIAAVRLVA